MSVLVSEQTPIRLKQSQVNPEPDKKKKKFHRIFSTTRNPVTAPPSKSLHDISAKPHQTTISQYPHVSSPQKVTHQPKHFDPTTNKPHLSILAIVKAPHQLLEKPATTTTNLPTTHRTQVPSYIAPPSLFHHQPLTVARDLHCQPWTHRKTNPHLGHHTTIKLQHKCLPSI